MLLLKGTKTPIDYIGEDNLEFVNYNNEALKKYHELFIDIYNKSFLIYITLN